MFHFLCNYVLFVVQSHCKDVYHGSFHSILNGRTEVTLVHHSTYRASLLCIMTFSDYAVGLTLYFCPMTILPTAHTYHHWCVTALMLKERERKISLSFLTVRQEYYIFFPVGRSLFLCLFAICVVFFNVSTRRLSLTLHYLTQIGILVISVTTMCWMAVEVRAMNRNFFSCHSHDDGWHD
jgi:hypothetical protein